MLRQAEWTEKMKFLGGLFRNVMPWLKKGDAALLLESGLFDSEFYAAQVDAGEEPSISHFLTLG